MEWLILQSSVPLLSRKGEAVTPAPGILYLEVCFIHSVNKTVLDWGGSQAEF